MQKEKKGSPRILIIEDDPFVAKPLLYLLNKKGFDVLVATDGAEGLQTAIRQKIDLIITDIMMPNMNGIEAIDALKKIMPEVSIMTYSSLEIDKVKEMLGDNLKFVDHFLRKPIPLGDILDHIKRILKTSEND